jgi:pantoate--beta-alanine ligase
MEIINDIGEMRQLSAKWRREGKSIGFVPTMGYLHPGHLSLIKQAREDNARVVVSIFVNPSQFGPKEDYARYPRDMASDSATCQKAGVDVIFAPVAQEMYPAGYITYVEPTMLSERLCGVTRPGHFRGVCTVVLKLINIVQPDQAYFGQKDAQQLIILSRMIHDLNLDAQITLHPMPIVREADGLAMSSRNVYLKTEERKQAPALYRALLEAERLFAAGENDTAVIREAMIAKLAQAPLAKIDYLEIVDTVRLLPVTKIKGETLIAIAVYFGATRLIDNTVLAADQAVN